LNRFDASSETWTAHRHDPSDAGSLANDFVTVTYVDSAGSLWAGTLTNGLDRLRPGARAFEHFRRREGDPTSLNHDAIWAIAEGESGTLWVGTGNGLNHFDADGRALRSFLPNPADTTALWGSIVQGIHPAGDVVWVATNAGLNQLDLRTERFRRWTYADGLPAGDVGGLLEDSRGNLCLGTARGLVRFDPRTEEMRTYGVGDGLAADAFSQRAAVALKDGRFAFGHREGFTRFDPDGIVDDPSTPRVALTDLLLDRAIVPVGPESVLTESLSRIDTLELGSRIGTVALRFAVIDFSGGGPSAVRYRLVGQDADWVVSDARDRDATYTNLRPGTYTLEVAAANSAGAWGASEGLEIFVATPWTETLWFRVSVAMLVLGGAYLSHHARLRAGLLRARDLEAAVQARTHEVMRQKQEIESRHSRLQEALRQLAVAKEEAERANRVRNLFLATVSHELRTPLHAVNGFSQLLEKAKGLDAEQRAHARTIGEAGSRLLGIVDDILEMAEIEAGRMSSRLERFEPARLVDQVRSHLSARAAERKVGLALDIDEIFPMLVEADLTNLGRVLERLLANAIARSPSGADVRLWMSAAELGDGIQVTVLISDEGPSIDPAEYENIFEPFRSLDPSLPTPEGAGLGLPISRRLARLMRGDVLVSSGKVGATFTLSFPAKSPTGPPRVRERRDGNRLSDAVFEERVRRLIEGLPEEARAGLEGALREGDVDGFVTMISALPGEHGAEVRWLNVKADLFQIEALLGLFPQRQGTPR
jgi:signal transduction histidine kinase